MGVVQRGSGLGFQDETLLGCRVPGHVRREEFQGDEAFEIGVLGFIDHPHPAFTEFFEDPVMGDNASYHGFPSPFLILSPVAH